MPPVKNVGKPCAGEPHARFDGRELETERTDHGHGEERPSGKPVSLNGLVTYRQNAPPRQLPTLPLWAGGSCCPVLSVEAGAVVEPFGAGLVASSPPGPVQVVGRGLHFAGGEDEQAFDLGDGQSGVPQMVGIWGPLPRRCCRSRACGVSRKLMPCRHTMCGASLDVAPG
jgi:hypothetical protein